MRQHMPMLLNWDNVVIQNTEIMLLYIPMAEFVGKGEFLSDETLAIATAMTERNIAAGQEVQRILATLSGAPFTAVSDEAKRASQISETAHILRQVDDPSFVIQTGDQIVAAVSSEEITERAARYSEQFGLDAEASAAALKRAYRDTGNKVDEQSETRQDGGAAMLARQLNAAREVASEQGVTTATVFEQDDLYFEAARRSTTPGEFIAEQLDLIKSLSADILKGILITFIAEAKPQQFEGLSADEMTEVLIELDLSAGMQTLVESLVGNAQEAVRQLFVIRAARRWGADVLQLLALEGAAGLVPTRPLVPEVESELASILS